MVIYISGPMTGIPQFNFPEFDRAEEIWTAKGCQVLSPAQTSRAVGYHEDMDPSVALSRPALEHLLAIDVACLFYADALALLPGWENSKGAAVELSIAQFLGMQVYDAFTCGEIWPKVKPWSAVLRLYGGNYDEKR